MSDYVVRWSGTLHRQDEQAFSLLGEGWIVRSNALLDAAPHVGKYEQKIARQQTIRYQRRVNCPCGKEIKGSGHKRCWDCRQIDPQPLPKCHCGRAIRSPGKDRCGKCRERSSYRGRYKVRAA